MGLMQPSDWSRMTVSGTHLSGSDFAIGSWERQRLGNAVWSTTPTA